MSLSDTSIELRAIIQLARRLEQFLGGGILRRGGAVAVSGI